MILYLIVFSFAVAATFAASSVQWYGMAWFAGVTAVLCFVSILSRLRKPQDGPDYMTYLTHITTRKNNILWELKGAPDAPAAALLQAEYYKLDKEEKDFWKTHKYEDPLKGGAIVDK